MDIVSATRSQVTILFGVLLITVAIAALAYIEMDGGRPAKNTTDQVSRDKEIVAEIRSSNRPGNVVKTSVYAVELNNGTSFTFTESRPGPGSLCNTDNPKPSCKTRTEEGYTRVEAALSNFDFSTSEEASVQRYVPEKKLCVTDAKPKSIKIREC